MNYIRAMIGFELMCLAIIAFCVSVFDDERTIKEKLRFVIGAMALLSMLFVGVWLMMGGV